LSIASYVPDREILLRARNIEFADSASVVERAKTMSSWKLLTSKLAMLFSR